MPDGIRVGLMTAGTGAHVSAYLEGLKSSATASSVAVADPSGQHFEMAQKILGDKLQKTYASHRTLLKEFAPQMTVVTQEAVASPPVIADCLEAGCHVLTEKPACIRAADFAELVRTADSKHLHLMLALANRINKPVLKAKELVHSGDIGQVYGLEMHIIADHTRLTSPAYHQSWYADKQRAGGGHLIWLGIHWLDLAMLITGSKTNAVTGFAGNVGGEAITVEDSAAVSLQFDNNTFGTMTSGYYLDRGYHSHIKIWGSHGWLELTQMEDVPLRWYSTRNTKTPTVQIYDGPKERGYSPFVDAAVKASVGIQAPPITCAEGLHVRKTIYAFYEAVTTGQTQTIA